MYVESKKMNWLRSRSPWEEAEAWREHRRAMSDQFQAESDAALTGFSNAVSNQISGIATIATQMAATRLQKAAKAKQDEMAAQLQKTLDKIA